MATELDRAVGDLTMVAFYYLLWIGEYTIKGKREETKQTAQFRKNGSGQLRCLAWDAPDHYVMTADGAQ